MHLRANVSLSYAHNTDISLHARLIKKNEEEDGKKLRTHHDNLITRFTH